MNEEEKKALKVINARTRRLLDELEIEKENMSDELKIAYLMQEIRVNKTVLNLIEKLQKENEELKQEMEKRKWVHIKENGEVEPLFYISKDKIREKIEEEKLPLTIVGGRKNKKTLEYGIKLGRRQALQELIKEREDN